jgi:hypothetical protein
MKKKGGDKRKFRKSKELKGREEEGDKFRKNKA